MKYDKPHVVALGPAVESVQSSTRKINQLHLDASKVLATTAAYEADE